MAHTAERQANRLRLAETTSAIGAGVLGVGIGVLVAQYLANLGLAILISGVAIHGWGMADKRRLEQAPGAIPLWSTVLYWACWACLAALGVYVIVRLLRS